MADQSLALYAQPLDLPQVFTAASNLKSAGLAQYAQQQENDLRDVQLHDTLLGNAISTATDAQSWDEAMRNLSARGVKEARQYIGRYSPELQNSLSRIYGGGPASATGGSPTAAGGANGDQIQLALRDVPPEQLGQSLQRLDMVTNALNGVKDVASWDKAAQELAQSGIPQAAQFIGHVSDPATATLRARQILANIEPLRNAIQERLTLGAAGLNTATPPMIEKVGESLVSIDPRTGEVKPIYTAPQKGLTDKFVAVPNTIGANGAPLVLDKTTGQYVDQAGKPSGIALGDYASRITGAENSTGNPAATNPRSSATGDGQFLNATWLSLVKSERPELAKGKSDAQILAMRSDPTLSAEMTKDYAEQNAPKLASDGHPVTSLTLALAHRLGPDGANTVLSAAPDAKMESVLPASVIKANPDMKGQTVASYAQKLYKQVGNDPVAVGGNAPQGRADVPGDSAKHGDAYLATVPDQAMANEVKAIVQGRMQQPTSFFLKTPQGQMLMRMAAQYEPNFDLSLYQSRVKTQSDLATGTMGKNITSFNTAIGHAARLAQAIDGLGNSSFLPSIVNPGAQAIKGEFSPQFQAAKARFEADKQALTDELTRAFRGTGGNVSDIDKWAKTLDEANSPEALHSAVEEAMHLLGSRIEAVGEQYKRGMRLNAQFDPKNLLAPAAKTAFEQLENSGNVGGQNFPKRPSSIPPNSQYSPSRHQWRDPSGKLYDANGRPI